ncbi:MAG TPA: HEXXH motif-containing putative peptide modification protein [Pseudonocardia sp.]
MLIAADPTEARHERDTVRTALRDLLGRAHLLAPADALAPADVLPGERLDPHYPGTFTFAFDPPAADDPARPDALREVAGRARDSTRRAAGSGCPGWPVDLAPAEPHLAASVARAVAALPPGAGDIPPDVRLGDWHEKDRAVLRASVSLLGAAWPEILTELTVTVRQIALLDGDGVSGFTDFGCHGAIFVNRRRLTDTDAGLPARVRFAEALVHEGTHVRCNAAGWAAPLLADPTDRSITVSTPLRRDPRPLNGLFQQLAVLARCTVLYERTIAAGESHPSVAARRDVLHRHGTAAAETLDGHRAALSERGAATVDEALAALAPTSPARGDALAVASARVGTAGS